MNGHKAMKLLGKVYKGYIYKHLMQDVGRFAVDRWDDLDIDWSKKALLRRVGLKQAAPVKSAFGAFGFIALGCAVGCVAGLLLAPRPGAELRTQVKDRAMGFLHNEESATQTPATA